MAAVAFLEGTAEFGLMAVVEGTAGAIGEAVDFSATSGADVGADGASAAGWASCTGGVCRCGGGGCFGFSFFGTVTVLTILATLVFLLEKKAVAL